MFKALDHAAIVVEDTEAALHFYRDSLGLAVLFSEVLEEQGVRLTHLDLGNCQLQLVQPLTEDHPLQEALRLDGERVHHLCFAVDSLPESLAMLKSIGLEVRDAEPRRGTGGRQAVFLDPRTTRGLLIELSSDRPATDGIPPGKHGE